MIYQEIILGLLALFFCGYFAYTDIRFNLIKNSTVLVCGLTGAIISIVGYIIFARNLLPYYLINVLIAIVLSQILYAAHVWAAGGSKMYICMALILPIIVSLYDGRVWFSSIYIAAYAFLIGFIYLVIETIVLIIKKEIKIDLKDAAPQIKGFVFRYIRNIAIITGLWSIEEMFVDRTNIKYAYALAAANLCILMLISLIKEWIKNTIAVLLLITEIIVYFATGILSVQTINVKYYLLIVLLMIFRILVNDGNYSTISSTDVKKGMILSTVTTLMMCNSKIKGLPRISKENMADRLTEEEAEAVRKWGLIKGQPIDIQIVKKIPFAIFLTLGMIIQIISWGIYYFALNK